MCWVLLSSPETRTLEAFSKTGQGVLSNANDNSKKDEKKRFYFKLNLHNFIYVDS